MVDDIDWFYMARQNIVPQTVRQLLFIATGCAETDAIGDSI